jgi:anti-sigma factor RsiW
MKHDYMKHDAIDDERFEQLCALAAIGEVSAAEFSELNEHLASCSNCQELYSDFRRIASNELGAVATGRWNGGDSSAELDEQVLLGRLLERAHAEAGVSEQPSDIRPLHELRRRSLFGVWSLLRSPILATAALVLLICTAVGIAAYRIRDQQLAPTVAQLSAQLSQRESEVKKAGAQIGSSAAMLQQTQSEREALQHELAEARKSYAELLNRDHALETGLAAAREQLDQKGNELRQAHEVAQQSGDSLKTLQTQLREAVMRTTAEENLVEQLQRKLQHRSDDAVVASTVPAIQNGDAKEIFGARDLHIVDVYDVDATGKTKRGFGRVYFVERKLLLFYAFDLQDKQHQRAASAFQAWGYRQGSEGKPQNLGLFLMDDPAVSRWVLKVNNTSVLERIDAVFVTLEPPNGSPSPRGRKLLYANLGGPPNHP